MITGMCPTYIILVNTLWCEVWNPPPPQKQTTTIFDLYLCYFCYFIQRDATPAFVCCIRLVIQWLMCTTYTQVCEVGRWRSVSIKCYVMLHYFYIDSLNWCLVKIMSIYILPPSYTLQKTARHLYVIHEQ